MLVTVRTSLCPAETLDSNAYTQYLNWTNYIVMKILLTGDIQFGRDYWDINKDCPNDLLKSMTPYFKEVDLIIFNLESVISAKDIIDTEDKVSGKPYHILATPSPLQYLRSMTNKPIIVATINNHTFDYGLKGYQNTLKSLRDTGFFFTHGYQYLLFNNVIFFDSTTHWTELESLKRRHAHINDLWKDNCWFIDMNDDKSIKHAISTTKKTRDDHPDKFIIMCIHWGKNWVDNMSVDFCKEERLAKSLIDSGCNIVFGSGAHHIVPEAYVSYNSGLIIYGLGDLSGDFMIKPSFNSPESLSLIYDTLNNEVTKIEFNKSFNQDGCGIPIPKNT
jgi:hypothetical protein